MENEHRTPSCLALRLALYLLVAKGCWLLEKEEHRTPSCLALRLAITAAKSAMAEWRSVER
jgi:hypothetical protein